MSAADTCPATVHPPGGSWGGRACGRTLKTDEQREAGLCGPHLAGRRRSDASMAAWRDREAAERVENETMRGIAGRFRGLIPDVEADDLSVSGGEILLRRPAAERLLELLEADDLAGGV
ncbi:hypothetical protein ACG83_10890 [Frankia sp. R43]|uniref:hypothetical protein n=1 Tax=Frankia sp. R43 TaxID=269536 RepID=UPI0006CA4A91|nr:hypothetical protein [Frankia sp. R43]KPM55771.1 hypothetical protein ACG83_10890 [Frankia sp. R43]